jgi:hypothetical protein
MARKRKRPRASGLNTAVELSKSQLLDSLAAVDANDAARGRVLQLETGFRKKVSTLLNNLPVEDNTFRDFSTSPFVLLARAAQRGYKQAREIEDDILVGKIFSSMETSAGRMVEEVALPVYGWTIVPSEMRSAYSVIDGELVTGGKACFLGLKSGPRCLNDDSSGHISSNIIDFHQQWAKDKAVSKVEFVFGALYGTKAQSNKKDWHVISDASRLLHEEHNADLRKSAAKSWDAAVTHEGVELDLSVKIGVDLWEHIGRTGIQVETAFVEICAALIRSCVAPGEPTPPDFVATIANFDNVIALDAVPDNYNVAILQRSQLEWLFLIAAHFCDELNPI